ncbi:MAG: hypothetical protein AB3N11_15755 [Arenibacterium sp.]
MTHRIFLIVVPTLALLGVASATFAESRSQRILTPVAGLCPSAIDDMAQWARDSEGYGAFAVPTDSNVTSCDDPDIRPVTAGTSSKAATMQNARDVALALCEASRDADLGPCVVIGTARSE